MGLDVSQINRDAMSVACSYARHHPDLIDWITSGDPRGIELLRRFEADSMVVPWLRHQVAYKRRNVELRDLLDKADDFVNRSGQALMLTETYRRQRDDGKLDKLGPTRFAVHRAVFSLGLYNGAPALASLRYIQTLVRAQSGISVVPATIRKHLHALTSVGLIDYRPGKRGTYKPDAGRVSLDLTPSFGPREIDVDLIFALSLTADQRLALSEYAEDAARQNALIRAEMRERQDKLIDVIARPQMERIVAEIFEESDRREAEAARPSRDAEGRLILYK